MPTDALRKTLNRLRQVFTSQDLTDAELLNRFLADRDEAAFAILVRRHGGMVMGVARRALGNVHDAEDVFQATFLFLAQKARSVVNRQALPGWLYTVAYRTALAARSRIDRRRKKEQQVEHMPDPHVNAPQVQDWQALLDEELHRLPEKYRLSLILCDLEGRPRKEVCRQLRLAEGTLSSRLTTGRRMLAERLKRRGLTLSAGALATMVSEATASASVPPGLVGTTVQGALLIAVGQWSAISSSVTILMKTGAKAMFLAKLKATLATVVVLAFVGGSIVYSGGDKTQPKSELDALRRENELLKVNLRVTLEKIDALEKQVATLKDQLPKVAYMRRVETRKPAADPTGAKKPQDTPGREVLGVWLDRRDLYRNQLETATKAWMSAQTKNARQQAIEALEKALKSLREMDQNAKPASP